MSITDDGNLFLGSFEGQEMLNIEYKEVILETYANKVKDVVFKEIFENPAYKIDKAMFDESTILDVKHLIEKNLPKYISTFNNTGISGDLKLGFTDSGIALGAPLFGNIDIQTILPFINKCFLSNIRVKDVDEKTNISILNQIRENIVLEIKQLTINESLLDDYYIERLEKIKADYLQSIEQFRLYRLEYMKWHSNIIRYSQKLKIIINCKEMRKEIIVYIHEIVSKKGLELDEYCGALKFYESDTLIDYDINMEVLNKEVEENNYNNIFTWLILFKDTMLYRNKILKPKLPPNRIHKINYANFGKQLCNVLQHLITQNCNFYTITFKIPKPIQSYILEYKDSYGEWNCKKRIISDEGPITVLY